jgi:glycosyltransferase involved in cell wall biosynthesis
VARGADDRVLVVDGQDRPAPYAISSLLLLPSHSENFGLVIAEALAAGVPTLVTDTTPWLDLRNTGAGNCVPWRDYPTALRATLAIAPDALIAQGRAGQQWMARDFSWAQAARKLQDFYRSLPHA